MEIYVVQPGDTLESIARKFGVPISQLMLDNRIPEPSVLVTGQALVVRFPESTYIVRQGDSLLSVSEQTGLSLRQLYRNNPALDGRPNIYPGQTLVLKYRGTPGPPLTVNAYAYPFINRDLLQRTLPFLTYLSPFTYGFNKDGSLVEPEDGWMLTAAGSTATGTLMHLSTLTDEGNFSSVLGTMALQDLSLQETLIENVAANIQKKGYLGLDVDFEFLGAENAAPYAAFIRRLRERLSPLPVIVALAPKTSADQPGLLYEGHDYRALGEAADAVLLMTYEWGYTYGPPMAVAPLPNVRRVVEYALTEIPAEKLWLGIPNYGYDWPLPYQQGVTRATSVSPRYAVSLAARYRASIQYDETSQAPWFRYTSETGQIHEVWFDDARSLSARLGLIPEYGMSGVGIWNLMRPFPQCWPVLDSLFTIRNPM